MSRKAAMSRNRTSGSRAMQSRARPWLVKKCQLAMPGILDDPVLETTYRFLATHEIRARPGPGRDHRGVLRPGGDLTAALGFGVVQHLDSASQVDRMIPQALVE